MYKHLSIKGHNRSRPQTFYVLCAVIALGTFFIVIFGDNWIQSFGENVTDILDKNENTKYKNYFLNAGKLKDLGLVVNTSQCKIVDFNPWDEDIMHIIKIAKPVEECSKTNYNWSHVENDMLVMHTEAMERDGHAFQEEHCCYRIIKRDKHCLSSTEKMKADNCILYSKCIILSKIRTKISAEFIMVECSWSKFTRANYRSFHGIVTSDKNPREKMIKAKIKYWKEKISSKPKSEKLPPNILIIGIDSTSRINFRRNMFKTKKMLETIGAVEMFGYQKVGENTFPNFCPLFAGYSKEELMSICGPEKEYFDNCPFIWKELDEAYYLTANTEDAPDFGAFNYLKPGFKEQQVDFYVRPMFLAAHDYGTLLHLIRTDNLDCISYQTNDEAITTYLESTIDFALREKAPIFSFAWSTTLSHGDTNMIQLVDDTYSQLLKNVLAKGQLNNTILFFMGDHGYRFGKIRETLIGYYEDKLPNMWIYLPPTVKEIYPEWEEALEINSRRPTSPYHFYWTIRHVLKTFTGRNNTTEKSHEIVERKYKQNFLQEVPEQNSCSAVGVPDRFCSCYALQAISYLADPMLVKSAEAAVQKINSDLNPGLSKKRNECATLKISKITAGAFIDKSSSSIPITTYIVAFVTEPGEFLIEADIDYFIGNETLSNSPNVQRANKINQKHISCIKDSKIELFCYCKKYEFNI